MGTSYIPFPPWAIFFCFIPLYLDLIYNAQSPWDAFKRAWVTQFVLTLIGFYWIAYVAHEFGFLPWPVAIFVLLLFGAGMHLHIPLAMALGFLLSKKFKISGASSVFVYALLLALADQLWPGMFPFHIGYSWLWIRSPLAQWADVVGFLGLGLLVHLTQATVGWIFLSKNLRLRAALLLGLLGIYSGLHFTGKDRQKAWETSDSILKVLMVQANIGNIEKIFAEKGRGYQREIANKYFSMTSEALEKEKQTGGAPVDLVIWPESAFPDALDQHNSFRTYTQQFVAFQKTAGVAILTGSYSTTAPNENPKQDFNALFLYEKDTGLENPPYRKTHLLAFGEFVPFGETFPILKKWNPGGEGFSRGKGPMTLSWRDYKIGPQICYESLYPEFSAKLVQQGAHFLVNLTNDSWFGPTSEPHQHLHMTLARALETRRPLLRSTNTGITTAIDAAGNILQQSTSFQPWSGIFEVGVRKTNVLTFYSQYGQWLPWLTVLLVLLTIFAGASRSSE